MRLVRVMAVQLGAALGWLSGKILGQYEALADPGRLLLQAPSIVQVAFLDVDSGTFACGCACTRKPIGFSSSRSMKGHFTGLVMKALDAFDETTPVDRLGAVLRTSGGRWTTPDTPT